MSAATRGSVVIPVHDRAGLTRRCLETVLAELPADCEAIVVDDASADATPRLLAELGDAVRTVRLERQSGFATACNAGAAIARGEHLVFLNNDTEPEPGWLAALLDHAAAHPRAEVIGARLLYPTGEVQHAGVVFGQDGYPHNLYAGFPGEHPASVRPRRLQAVTGACMLVRRAIFEGLGGFDAEYVNALEDVDLCLRVGEAGGEVHYCPEAIVVHLESASRGFDERFEASVARYRERWRERVRRDDLEVYAADGLIEVEYPRAHPLRLSISPLLASVERGDGHEAELEPVLRTQARRNVDLRRQVVRLAAELSDRGVEVELGGDDYEASVARVRAQAEGAVPAGATVLVLSRGDRELLRLGDREAKHFPGDGSGRYLGRHPADGREAVELLEADRDGGAQYLVIPAAESWWLDHYEALARHLEAHARAAVLDDCTVYALEQAPAKIEAGR
jgi:GT2 family glycosyltransferase